MLWSWSFLFAQYRYPNPKSALLFVQPGRHPKCHQHAKKEQSADNPPAESMHDLLHLLSNALGSGVEAKNLTVLQVCLRGIVVFASTLVMVRFAHKRFLAK